MLRFQPKYHVRRIPQASNLPQTSTFQSVVHLAHTSFLFSPPPRVELQVQSPSLKLQAPVTLPLMEQLSFPDGYELPAHDHDRAQALEKHTFRRSGRSTTGVGLPATNDTFDHAAATIHGFTFASGYSGGSVPCSYK